HDAGKVCSFARIVVMFDHVLKAEAVGLVLEFALVTVHDGSNSDLRHEDSRVANERSGGKACDGQADSRATGFLDLATIVHLEDVGHLMAQDKSELCFIGERAEQTSI